MSKALNGLMVVAMLMTAFVGIAPTASAASAGDLIKMASNPAVYYLGADNKRYVFPNQDTYMTWYGDFSGVVTVSDTELQSYQIGGNVTFRPGTELIKITTDPKVYAVEPGGVLRHVPSEAVAVDLFGANWASMVRDLSDAFFAPPTYTIGDPLTTMYPTGSLVKEPGGSVIYYIDGSEKRPIADEAAFAGNMWQWNDVREHDLSGYSDGASITGEESDITTVAGDGAAPGGNVSTGTLSVSISAMSPASTTYLASQARAEFLVVDLVNNSSGAVVVDSITIERGGLANDADFSSVALYETNAGGVQIGLNKTFNSDHRATVGDDITVAAGATKKIVVAGNIAASGTMGSGNTPKLGIYAMSLKGSAVLSASLPVWGNTMTLNSSVTIATATVAAGGSNPASDIAPKVGDTNVEIAEVKVTNNSSSNELSLEKIVVRQAGTVSDSDIEEYSLTDSDTGTVVATGSQVDKYVVFDLDPAITIGKSKNKSYMVKAVEITGGSGRTLQFDIYRNTDVVVMDKMYNAYITPTFPASSQPYLNNTVDQTIGNGSLKVEPDSDFVAANIGENQDDVQLGQWLFTVKGEEVDITNIEALLTIAGTGTGTMADITGGVFYDVESGAGLSGASDAVGSAGLTGGVSSTDTITLGVGVHKIGLRANLNADFATDDTITASIDPDSDLTVTGNITGNTITASPTSAQSSATLTIKAAKVAVSVSPSPAAQTVVRGTSGVEVARVQLDTNGSGDTVTISQLKTVIHTTTMNSQELSNLKIYKGIGGAELSVSNDPDSTLSATGSASVTTTWSFSPALTLEKNTVTVLPITVNISSTPSANESFAVGFQSGCTVTAKDSAGDDATATYSYSDGQTMTIQTAGTMTMSRSDDLENGFLTGNTTGITLGEFTFSAVYEDINIEKLYVDIAAYNSGGTDEFTAFYLYDGADQIASASVTKSNQPALLFNMESDPYLVETGSNKELKLVADTAVISKQTGVATNGNPVEGITPSILSTSVTAKGVSGQTASISSATLSFPSYALVKSKPTVSIAASGDDLSANGTYDLIDVTVAADSKGPIGLYKMTFKVATTTVTAADFEMYEGTVRVATQDTTATEGINISYVDASYALLEVYFNKSALGGEMREVSAGSSKTYTLRASVTGYNSSSSNSVSTSMTGDDALASTSYNKNAVAVDATDDDDFIWSDLSYGNTSTTATTTIEWLNGFLVDGLLTTTSSAKTI